MLKFLKFLVYLVITVAVIMVGGSFVLPGQVVVTRSIEIAAPQDKVFAIVGDMNRLQEYSPWHEIDPKTKYTLEVPAAGVGQKMSWTSDNPDVGSGTRTVAEYQPPTHVASDLDLPRVKAKATWDLEPAGSGTKATWSYQAKLDGIADRWFGLWIDQRIGANYEKGLAKLKIAAEKP